MTDYSARRLTMVDTQIRPSDVTKFPIIEAMMNVPRELFIPSVLREAAYAGNNIDLGEGCVMLEPRTLAKMLDVLDIQNDELVLDIGCGYGYSSAVISRLAEAVVAVEQNSACIAEAGESLAETGIDNVLVEERMLVSGASEHGPYDVIIIQGAIERLPDNIKGQLKDGGRICALFSESALGVVRIGYMKNGDINWRFVFNANAPVLPGFEKRPSFAL
ncbi:MAG: protein-L-isoaspartate O-methyltransferase [Roseovarius sp.]|nr:protein-L-isoaspartate O-methyltransferase [Roseovarius sp.]MCY4208993.1 protein-L-isoaspartate O-methyltransferase [Roseovarius sp.]MCY4317397.1 protein-L-isoaspartate O-methyltransferase [Roseovarius sp.]